MFRQPLSSGSWEKMTQRLATHRHPPPTPFLTQTSGFLLTRDPPCLPALLSLLPGPCIPSSRPLSSPGSPRACTQVNCEQKAGSPGTLRAGRQWAAPAQVRHWEGVEAVLIPCWPYQCSTSLSQRESVIVYASSEGGNQMTERKQLGPILQAASSYPNKTPFYFTHLCSLWAEICWMSVDACCVRTVFSCLKLLSH